MAEGVVIKIDGDASGFQRAVAEAPKIAEQALAGVTKGAVDASQALDGVARSGSSVFDSMAVGAAGGIDKLIDLAGKAEIANANLAALRQKVDETGAALAAAQEAARTEAAALDELQASAAITAELLGEANAALKDTSDARAWMQAKDDAREFETDLKKLDTEIAKQKKTVTNTDAAVQKLADSYAKLSTQLSTAEVSASVANEKFEVMAQGIASAADDSLGKFDKAAKTTMRGTGSLADVLEDLASGAFNEVSMGAMRSVRSMTGFGESTIVASAAARGLQTVIRGLIRGGAGWIALAGAIGLVVYKLYDYISGAVAAREATAALKEIAEDWQKTQAKTIYDTGNNPFESAGVSASDFTAVKHTRDWFDRMVETWTDGKRETNDILKAYTDEFKEGSNSLRQAVKDRQETLHGLGVDDPRSKEVLEQLDKWDEEIEKLLKKRQNGLLTDKEKARLKEVTKLRFDLEVEYGLKGGSGFDKIAAAVEADLARIKAEAEAQGIDPIDIKIPVEVYTDALRAGADGYKATVDALNQSYREQYAAIQTMTDRDEKAAAMKELNEQHQLALNKAQEEYNNLVANYGPEAFQSEEVQKAAADLEAINAALARGDGPEAIKALAEGLDEGKIASYIALLKQLQGAGEGDTDLGGGKTANALLENLKAVEQYVKDNPDALGELGKMLGAAGEEATRVMVDLSLTPEGQAIKDWVEDPAKTTEVTVNTTNVVKAKYEDFSGIEQAAIDNHFAANPGLKPEVLTNVGFYPNWAQMLKDAYDQGIVTVWDANGEKLPLTPWLLSFVSEDSVWIGSRDEAGNPKIDVIITPQLGSPEALGLAAGTYEDRPGMPGLTESTSDKVKAIEALVAALKEAEQAEKDFREEGDLFGADLKSTEQDATEGTISKRVQELLDNEQALKEISDLAAQAVNGLMNGTLTGEDAEKAVAYLEQVKGLIAAAGMVGLGGDLASGVAQGMTAYGWTPDAATLATNIESALRAATGSQSPATKYIPVGGDIAAGVGQGMEEADMSGAANGMSDSILTALSGNDSKFKSSGKNHGQGYADGIREKIPEARAAATALGQAAAAALRAAQKESSPAKVPKKSGNNFVFGYTGGIMERIKDAQAAGRAVARAGIAGLNVGGLHMAAMAGGSIGASLQPFPFTLDELADAVAQRPANMYAKGRLMATTLATDNARAIAIRRQRIAAGYGGR